MKNRQTILESACVFLVIQLLVYLLTAFIIWDFNPANWSMGIRFFSALIGGYSGMVFSLFYLDFKSNK